MKVLLLSTFDTAGGAARAAFRLHKGLQGVGVDSQLAVQSQSSDDETVIAPKTKIAKGFAKLRPSLDILPLQLYSKHDRTIFSPQWLPDRIAANLTNINPDLVNLHWLCKGFIRIETLNQINKPLVWTLHDMWPFTGGCHYNEGCDRYLNSCGKCPQIDSNKNWDLSRWIWRRKARSYKNLNLTVVTPSLWLAKYASSSSLFKNLRVEVIPNGLSIWQYKPMYRQIARDRLNVSTERQLILFGAESVKDRRKGFALLQSALLSLSKSGWQDRIELIVFGASRTSNPTDFGFKTHYLGSMSDDIALSLVYAAADVFVAPSLQDNLPNTVMEAIACGTPCVAFNIGGMPDLIEHQQNGYLAQPYETEDLARGIAWVLENKERHQKLGDRARQKAEREFNLELQANRYLSLFTEILSKKDD